jgi:16S rRNA (guanine1207-N2)-methyltransferase
MLDNTSQLLLRNIDFLSGKVLLVEPMADRLAGELKQKAPELELFCLTSNIAVANNWQQQSKSPCYLGDALPADLTVDKVVLFYPKSKDQLQSSLAQVKTVLNDKTEVYLVGDNKGGIKSLGNQAEKLGLKAFKHDNAKHCLWFELDGLLQSELKTAEFHQFSIEKAGISLKLCSLPGVFNHGKLDLGTNLLLEHLGHIQQGKVLDFACGAGFIGAFLVKRHPEIKLTASDISTLAVSSTAATLKANKLPGEALAADGIPSRSAAYDHIVSNPPFHTGLKTDYHISEQFFRDAFTELKPGGTLTLVANVHLPYVAQLTEIFGQVKELGRRDGFVVYYCKKDRK